MGKMKKIVLACMAIGAAKMSFTVEVANASAKTVFVMESECKKGFLIHKTKTSLSHRADCTADGRDERNCLRLSKSMGMQGYGKLEVWNVTHNTWSPVCGEKWGVPEESELVCKRLGYRRSNETRLQDETKNSFADSNAVSYVTFPKKSTKLRKKASAEMECHKSTTSVHIKCEHFGKQVTRPEQVFTHFTVTHFLQNAVSGHLNRLENVATLASSAVMSPIQGNGHGLWLSTAALQRCSSVPVF